MIRLALWLLCVVLALASSFSVGALLAAAAFPVHSAWLCGIYWSDALVFVSCFADALGCCQRSLKLLCRHPPRRF
eukprot:jgi/Astpho2/9758/Aster-03735